MDLTSHMKVGFPDEGSGEDSALGVTGDARSLARRSRRRAAGGTCFRRTGTSFRVGRTARNVVPVARHGATVAVTDAAAKKASTMARGATCDARCVNVPG